MTLCIMCGLTGVEHYLPQLADLCVAALGVSHLDAAGQVRQQAFSDVRAWHTLAFTELTPLDPH